MGIKLSRVQDFAVELAMLLDDRAAVREQSESFKRALVTADPNFWIGKLYADRIEHKEEPEEDYDLDAKGVTWIMPEISEDEFAALERELANRSGTLTIEDLEDEEGWQ